MLYNEYRASYYDHLKDPWIDFALGIVIQAIKDYKKAIKAGRPLNEYRRFFRSDWFNTLTRDRISGDYIIKSLEGVGGKPKVEK